MMPADQDNRSTAEIIAAAYATQDEEAYWHLIGTLHGRGTETEFRAAEELAHDQDPIKREIGADILGQLGWAKQHYQQESVAILIKLLSDPCDDVIASAAFSLGHRNDILAVPALKKHLRHPDPRVRHGIAFGLKGLDDEAAVQGLIELSKDADKEVRNWATFGLGSQCDIDTAELRAALIARTEDDNPEIRGEALVGLASRQDRTVTEKIAKELSGEFEGGWAIEAAQLMPDESFAPLLQALLDSLAPPNKEYFGPEIAEAIAACKKAS